jgi:hypothetical protein
MAKTCLMIGKRTVQGETVYRLTVYSSTLAEVRTETLQGVVTERREYVGSRAQATALVTWSKLTGLTGGAA